MEIAPYMFPPIRRADNSGDICRLSPEEAGCYAALSNRLQMTDEEFRLYVRSLKEVVPPPPETGQGSGVELSCRAGRCSFWLDWQGQLSPCGMFPDHKHYLRGQPFRQVWETVVRETDQARYLHGCEGCPNASVCHTCAAAAYCETGNPRLRPFYKCIMLLKEAETAKKLSERMDPTE